MFPSHSPFILTPSPHPAHFSSTPYSCGPLSWFRTLLVLSTWSCSHSPFISSRSSSLPAKFFSTLFTCYSQSSVVALLLPLIIPTPSYSSHPTRILTTHPATSISTPLHVCPLSSLSYFPTLLTLHLSYTTHPANSISTPYTCGPLSWFSNSPGRVTHSPDRLPSPGRVTHSPDRLPSPGRSPPVFPLLGFYPHVLPHSTVVTHRNHSPRPTLMVLSRCHPYTCHPTLTCIPNPRVLPSRVIPIDGRSIARSLTHRNPPLPSIQVYSPGRFFYSYPHSRMLPTVTHHYPP